MSRSRSGSRGTSARAPRCARLAERAMRLRSRSSFSRRLRLRSRASAASPRKPKEEIMQSRILAAALIAASAAAFPVMAQQSTYEVKFMPPAAALLAAQAALKQCRALGYQVAVALVDRSGTPQVVLRDRFAGPHTVRTAIGKAWTAASFRTDTSELVDLTQPGKPQSGVRGLRNVVVLGG